MVRLIDASPDCEDELPSLDKLLEMGAPKIESKPVASINSDKTRRLDLTLNQPGRRIRRIGTKQEVPNPLLKPWDGKSVHHGIVDTEDSTSSSQPLPTKLFATAGRTIPHSDANRRVNTQPLSQLSYSRFQYKNLPRGGASSIKKNDKDNHPSCKGKPRTHFDGFQCETEQVDRRETHQTTIDSPSKRYQSRRVSPRRSTTQERCLDSDGDESSVFHTAEEEPSEYSDSNQSCPDSDSYVVSGVGQPIKLPTIVSEQAWECDGMRTANSPSLTQIHDLPISGGKTKPNITLVTSQHWSSERSQAQFFQPIHDMPQRSEVINLPPRQTPETHTSTRQKRHKTLVSPHKPPRISAVLKKTSAGDFWNQEVTHDWNDQHSLGKSRPTQLLAGTSVKSKRETKRAFESRKHQLAINFLDQLDRAITDGKIASLARTTGGVQIVWTKTLNTTAGRANWRREAVRTKQAGSEKNETLNHKHHASIELAEKVIDDEHRLFNVLAHEFCHLANFMINGITNNPHGKEFKVWAAKCSQSFSAQGIEVTTKHTFEIEFKYVWTCVTCGSEYKRHSKSIDPQRHRCGNCKSLLKQTRPVPRGAGGVNRRSQYQLFMKEHMKMVRSTNPGITQKEVMGIVGEKWANRSKGKNTEGIHNIDAVAGELGDLSLGQAETGPPTSPVLGVA